MSRFLTAMILMLSLAGCVTATVVEKERVDMEVSGNQGYLAGEVPESAESSQRTRKVVQIDVELPTAPEMGSVKKIKGFDWAMLLFWRKRAVAPAISVPEKAISVEPVELKEPAPESEPDRLEVEQSVKKKEESKEVEKEKLVTVYTVGKNESLWNIAAKEEIYGNPVKWTKIYEANRDKIGNPNKIKDGMVLKIPRD